MNFFRRLIASRKLREGIEDEQIIFVKCDQKGRMVNVSFGRFKEGCPGWERFYPPSIEERNESALRILGITK